MDPITAERAAAVLEGCKRSLKEMAMAPVDLLTYRDDLIAKYGSAEDRELLSEQKNLERRYHELSQKRIDLRGLSNKKVFICVQDEAQHVGKKMKEGTRALFRRLKEGASVSANLEKVELETSELAALLAATTRELHHRREFLTLRRAVEDTSKDQKESVLKEDKDVTASVNNLKTALQSEKEIYEKEVLRLTSETNELTEELLAIRNGTHQKTLAHRAETSAKKDALLREFRQDQEELRDEIRRLKSTVEKENRAHEEVISFLSEKTNDLEVEICRRKEQFEDILQKKEMKYAKLVDERDENLGVLLDVQRRWDRDEAKKRELDEEKERERKRKMDQEEQEEREFFAAVLIQKKAKSLLKRKARANASKGKKRGGKKSKKGKKK